MGRLKYIGKCLLVKSGKKNILAVGDLHLGYEEYMNQRGVFVSRKMFEKIIEDFKDIFSKIGNVDRVVLLGDVKHDFSRISKQEWGDTLGLLDYLAGKCKKIIIVKGNHDNILGSIVCKREKIKLEDFYMDREFCFLHGHKDFQKIYSEKIKYWIVGHGHPAVKISDGIKDEKYKCFLTGMFGGRKVVVVPSFAEYNAGSDPRENNLGFVWNFNLKKFDVFVIGGKLNVLNFGKLERLNWKKDWGKV